MTNTNRPNLGEKRPRPDFSNLQCSEAESPKEPTAELKMAGKAVLQKTAPTKVLEACAAWDAASPMECNRPTPKMREIVEISEAYVRWWREKLEASKSGRPEPLSFDEWHAKNKSLTTGYDEKLRLLASPPDQEELDAADRQFKNCQRMPNLIWQAVEAVMAARDEGKRPPEPEIFAAEMAWRREMLLISMDRIPGRSVEFEEWYSYYLKDRESRTPS